MGSKWVVHWNSETWWEWSEITGSPQGFPPTADSVSCEAKGGPTVGMKPGQKRCVRSSHCWHGGLVMVQDKARLIRGQRNNQSRWGHQCSETTLTGEFRFRISPHRGFEPRSLVTRSKRVVHWTSETWWEWCVIAGSPHAIQQALLSEICVYFSPPVTWQST
jgi:hypothetical protein